MALQSSEVTSWSQSVDSMSLTGGKLRLESTSVRESTSKSTRTPTTLTPASARSGTRKSARSPHGAPYQ